VAPPEAREQPPDTGINEPLRELDLDLRGLMRDGRHAGEDAAGHQPQREPVRVVEDDRVPAREVE
jgi:hypothetical protein